jgi:N-acetylglucosaminyl-diphospho-decaprenol L-rhamnosyltransferase
MTIDVVVVAYNSAGVIERCLAAVAKVDGIASITVVDHGAQPSVRNSISDPSNPGYGAGQNRGRAVGNAPYVLMLNPDAEVDAEGVAAGVALLAARPDVAMVQGVIESHAGAPERSAGRALGPVHLWGRALKLRALLTIPLVRLLAARVPALADHAERRPATARDVEALAAVAVLARRTALDEVGGFDSERYFLYGEDADLCLRLRRAGWKLVALPDRWAAHLSGASSASTRAREVEWWRGTMAYARRWWPWHWRLQAEVAALVVKARLALLRR